MIIPSYYDLLKNHPKSIALRFHNWAVPISVISSLFIIVGDHFELLIMPYMLLFGLFYLVGNTSYFRTENVSANSYKILGSLGSIALLLFLSFSWYWDELGGMHELFESTEFIVGFILAVASAIIFRMNRLLNSDGLIKPLEILFIVFPFIFFIGYTSPLAAVLVNMYVFIIGVIAIKEATEQNVIGKLNFGLLIISALIVCRFFDTDLSFIFKGLLFVLVGAGFFISNYWMLKKRTYNG